MKRCPQCYEIYEDAERFCDTDGRELLPDPTCSSNAFAPNTAAAAPVASASPVWLPAAAFGILIGLVIGAGIFIAVSLMSRSNSNEPQTAARASEVQQSVLPNRTVAKSNPAPTPEPEESPSPETETEAEAAASPAVNADSKTAAVQLNQGPISTGQKIKPGESEGSTQTVIEMTDGSTLDVDAAWEDKQGIWYRRSGLVSFVESSRVKAISARKGTKPAEAPDR